MKLGFSIWWDGGCVYVCFWEGAVVIQHILRTVLKIKRLQVRKTSHRFSVWHSSTRIDEGVFSTPKSIGTPTRHRFQSSAPFLYIGMC